MINLVTAADDKYMPHVGAMLNSVFENNSSYHFAVHFLHRKSVNKDNLNRLASLCASHDSEFHPVPVNSAFLKSWPVNSRYVEEAWYRLKLASLLPELDKVLWLDADVLVMTDIGELWKLDMNGQSVAAVCNAMPDDEEDADLPVSLELVNKKLYFNSGVMLIRLDQWRLDQSENQFELAIKRYQNSIKYADQDVLNVVFNQGFQRLPLKWNAMTGIYFYPKKNMEIHGWKNLAEAWHRPSIIHFTGNSFKPWEFNNRRHPYQKSYLCHRSRAGWDMPASGSVSLKRRILRALPSTAWLMMSRLRQGRLSDLYWLIKASLSR